MSHCAFECATGKPTVSEAFLLRRRGRRRKLDSAKAEVPGRAEAELARRRVNDRQATAKEHYARYAV
jgi:hypothetical protein